MTLNLEFIDNAGKESPLLNLPSIDAFFQRTRGDEAVYGNRACLSVAIGSKDGLDVVGWVEASVLF